jgi:hypothetical protein
MGWRAEPGFPGLKDSDALADAFGERIAWGQEVEEIIDPAARLLRESRESIAICQATAPAR